MHIAVCEDNVADRKQTERLLARESLRRSKTEGNLYVDSFGNAEALLRAPMKYDLFFLDMNQSSPNGHALALNLRKAGVTAPIVLMNSVINYREFPGEIPRLLYLDKPIKSADLASLLDTVRDQFSVHEATIELRERNSVCYVKPDDFLYARPDGSYMKVTLSSGKTVLPLGGPEDLARSLTGFEEFVIISGKNILNMNHITEYKKRTITMSDGAKFTLGLTERRSFAALFLRRHPSVSEDLTDQDCREHNDTAGSLS